MTILSWLSVKKPYHEMLNENGKRNMKNIEVQETVKLEDDFEFYDGEIAS